MALISMHPHRSIELYHQGRHDELSEQFISVLNSLGSNTITSPTTDHIDFIDTFCKIFLYVFVKKDFSVSEKYYYGYLSNNPLISNIVALTPSKTTDRQLETLSKQNDSNLVKILTLLSPRNSIVFDRSSLFDSHPVLVSIWYSFYFESVAGYPGRLAYDNINNHQRSLDNRWVIATNGVGGPTFPYFFSTYVNPCTDRYVRRYINSQIKPLVPCISMKNRPNPKKIAIVSGRWSYGNVVYRCLAGFVDALCADYEVTLIRLGDYHTDFDRTKFSDIRTISLENDDETKMADLSSLHENDFMLAFFTDIGMQNISLQLSNCRFAPIQVTGYGHPVSTWGGEIDYFIGGVDAEIAALASEHYSERLVLIPGIGVIPCLPAYQPRGIVRQDSRIIINCPWGALKFNHPHLMTLREIIRCSEKDILFRFFPGGGIQQLNAFLPFVLEIEEILGSGHVEVIPDQAVDRYMKLMEQGDFAIDSWPFGGYNSIIDSLWLGKPVVTLEGDMFINRASSALLRQVGLDELIAKSKEEYVEIAVRLIVDVSWRNSLRKKILDMDLERMVFDPGYANSFKKAIDYLIRYHEILKADSSREPIIIE